MISGDLAGLMRNLTANPFANTISFKKTPAHGLPAEKFCGTGKRLNEHNLAVPLDAANFGRK
jgi:hypothetical protein